MSNPAKVKAATEQVTDTDEEQEVDVDVTEEDDQEEPEVTDESDDNDDELDAEAAFEKKVIAATNSMKQDAKGNWVLPEGLSHEVKVAARLEKRRRDTQSGYTKTAQEKKRLEAEKAALLTKVKGSAKIELSAEEAQELEDLKFSDPDAWRKKMNRLEREALAKQETDLNEELKQVSTSSLEAEELEDRKQVLADFNRKNPGFKINDDIIANDIPPRIVKRLETGAISFEAFLQEAHEYLKTGKVVKQTEKTIRQPNLNKVGGSSSPERTAVREDAIKSYTNEIY